MIGGSRRRRRCLCLDRRGGLAAVCGASFGPAAVGGVAGAVWKFATPELPFALWPALPDSNDARFVPVSVSGGGDIGVLRVRQIIRALAGGADSLRDDVLCRPHQRDNFAGAILVVSATPAAAEPAQELKLAMVACSIVRRVRRLPIGRDLRAGVVRRGIRCRRNRCAHTRGLWCAVLGRTWLRSSGRLSSARRQRQWRVRSDGLCSLRRDGIHAGQLLERLRWASRLRRAASQRSLNLRGDTRHRG